MAQRFTRSLNLNQVVSLLFMALVLAIGLIISLLTWQHLSESLFQEDEHRTQLQLQHLSIALAPSLVSEDRISLNLSLSEWDFGHRQYLIRVLTTDGERLAEKGQAPSSPTQREYLVTQDEQLLGVLELTYSPDDSQRLVHHYLSISLLVTALSALIAGILGYYLGNRLSLSLQRLEHAVLDPNHQIPLSEAGSSALNIVEIERLFQLLEDQQEASARKKDLDQALNKFLLNNDKPASGLSTYSRCALLYIEIPDLDVLQSRLTATELANSLNEYHNLLNQAAKLYNGRLDRYQGDGLVMIFGLHEYHERDTLHCLYAASLCIGLIHQAQQRNPALSPIGFRCAAHWGPILLTPIRNEENNSDQYSLVGDSLYWTSHLARQGEELRLLVSQTLIDELPEDSHLDWQEGPQTKDLQGNRQNNFWLEKLPATSQTLVDRQIEHILSMTESV